MDVHLLRVEGFPVIAAIGGARLQPTAVTRLPRLGFESVVLAFGRSRRTFPSSGGPEPGARRTAPACS